MEENDLHGAELERTVHGTIVRVSALKGEAFEELYSRFDRICQTVEDTEVAKERALWIGEVGPDVEEAVSRTKHLFELSPARRAEAGLTNDYHMVILSLLLHFDSCMGSAAIANEWKINSGRVSRVFTASRKTYEEYRGHFEKCRTGGYRFTREGLIRALEQGIPEILGERTPAGNQVE